MQKRKERERVESFFFFFRRRRRRRGEEVEVSRVSHKSKKIEGKKKSGLSQSERNLSLEKKYDAPGRARGRRGHPSVPGEVRALREGRLRGRRGGERGRGRKRAQGEGRRRQSGGDGSREEEEEEGDERRRHLFLFLVLWPAHNDPLHLLSGTSSEGEREGEKSARARERGAVLFFSVSTAALTERKRTLFLSLSLSFFSLPLSIRRTPGRTSPASRRPRA